MSNSVEKNSVTGKGEPSAWMTKRYHVATMAVEVTRQEAATAANWYVICSLH
jgi:hypothetical protein